MTHTVSPGAEAQPEAESVWTAIPPFRPYRADACDPNPEDDLAEGSSTESEASIEGC